MLWVVGGSIDAARADVMIPGYMVIGRDPLCGHHLGRDGADRPPADPRVEPKNAGEAQFRYELTRVRDNAESIALIGGDDDERARLDETFGALAARWLARHRASRRA